MRVRPRRSLVFLLTFLLVASVFVSLAPTAVAVDWTKKDLGNVGGTVYGVATGDANNDGSDEVYAAAGNGGVFQFEQDDDSPMDWSMTTVGYGEGNNFRMMAIAVGDGRDSGNVNIYAGGYDTSYNGKMYEFLKTQQGWQKNQMGTGGYAIFDVDLGDGDNDDRNEVYAASYDGRVYEYSYSNGWNAKDIGYATYYQRGVAVGDGDNDGNVEVFSAGGYWTYKHAYMYKYSSSSSSWTMTDLGQPPTGNTGGVIMDIAIGDGDNDGNNELYVVDYQYVYQIEKSGTSWSWTTIFTNTYQYMNHVEVGDGDADGKNEVFASSATDNIYMLTYSSGSWGSESVGSGSGDMYGVCVGNGDNFGNQLEVYGGSADSHVYQWSVDVTPPPNPKVTSPTHEVGVWSNISNVVVNWRPPPDPSGIDGYSFEWNTNATKVPDSVKDGEETMTKTESGPLADGDSYYFHIRARDNALNWNPGATHFGPLKIDTGKPTDISVVIDDDAQYTNNKLVTLKTTGKDARSGMGYMAFSNDGTTWPDFKDWLDWSDSYDNWDLTSIDKGGNDNDGDKTVYMKARDKAGNVADGIVKDTIFLDRQKPVGLSIVINDGAQYTTQAEVTLNLSASDTNPASGLYQMRFSNDGANWSSWESWNSVRSDWSLVDDAGGEDSDGVKTVHFKVRDKAGNIAGPMKDDIILDRDAPGSLSLIINGGQEYTNVTNVQLNITANDPSPGSGIDVMRFSNDNSAWSSWEGFSTVKNPWSLTVGAGGTDTDGNKTVYLEVKDLAGNVGGPARDRIFLDRAKPTQLKIVINNGASLTNKVDVTLALSAVDPDPASGLLEMRLREGSSAWGSWEPWTTSKAFTLSSGDGTKTVSFQVRDRAGNLAGPASDSIVLDTTAPVISNIKVIGITDTSAIVTWTTDSPADGVVEYGTTASYGNQKTDATMQTDHSITLTGLTPETLYHFRVASTDEVGNGPTVSADHTFTTEKTPDTTPPIITNVRVEGITDVFAIVLWDTNEPADSYVHYGKTMDYGLVVGSATHLKKHSVSLNGLESDTQYYFKVMSTDSSGNGPVEAMGQFRTTVSPDTVPPMISNVKVSGITDKLAVITWTTDEVADSIVEYGTSSSYGSVVTSGDFVREHQMTLENLNPATTYYFIVRSTDPSGNGPTTSAQYTFQTDASADLTPPVISNVRATGITNTMAVITWNTNELADSFVEYGITLDYGSMEEDLASTMSHSITLTGLSPSTAYHFRVLSTDLSGNGPSKSEDFTFTTTSIEDKEPPIIQDVLVKGVTADLAVVLWTTNEPATSLVEYGESVVYNLTERDEALVLKHSVVVKGLTHSTQYHFRVASTDASGNGPTYSGDYTFTTLNISDTVSPGISNVVVTNITKNSATISWQTDEPGTTLIAYGENTTGQPIGDSTHFFTEHTFVLQDLKPKTTYFFRIFSDDPSGNRGSSATYNFTTLKDKTPPGPGPDPDGPGLGDDLTWLYILILVIVLCVVAVGTAWYLRSRGRKTPPARRPGREGPPTKAGARARRRPEPDDEEAYLVEELGMEGEDDVPTVEMGMDDDGLEDMGTLDMGDDMGGVEDMGTLEMGDEAGGDGIQLGAAISAVTTAAPAAAAAAPKKREPVRKVRCPGCKTAIPIYSETQTDIKCSKCGKEGKIKPMQSKPKAAAPPGSAPVTKAARPATPKAPKAAAARTRTPASATAGPKRTPLKTLTCSGCRGKVPVYTAERPVRITCPTCGKSGTLKR